MLAEFVCPDGQKYDVDLCLQGCRMGTRCLTRSTLRTIARDRSRWDGVPHVTQLLNGTLAEYLAVSYPFAVDPKSRAFSLLGTNHHAVLERETDSGEVSLTYPNGHPWIQGTADNPEEENGELVLTDYKTWGSYRVGRALGLQQVGPSGMPWGSRAVKDKSISRWVAMPELADLRQEELQLNMYRIMLEAKFKEMGIDKAVSRMQLQVTVRDGGLQVATSRGITETIYVLPVRKLPDEHVVNLFKSKAVALLRAVSQEELPPMCSDEETWNGKRCVQYCDVRQVCPFVSPGRIITNRGML